MGPCATFQVWPPPLRRVEPSLRMLWMAALLQWCLTALQESAELGVLREAEYALIYSDKCKVGLQLGRNGCCLLHRQCLLPLI